MRTLVEDNGKANAGLKRVLIQVIIAALAGIVLSSCMPNYSNGEWIGTVTKLSRKGLLFKSWEGQIVIGGVRSETESHYNSKGEYAGSTTSAVTNAYEFNVDPSVVEKVKSAMNSGRAVKLTYRQWLMSPWTISNDHVVINVTEL